MTLDELENELITRTDNNYDNNTELYSALNTIIRDLNLKMSAKFKTIKFNDELDKNLTLEELTGIPSIIDIIILLGMFDGLQVKEDESTWTRYQAQYNSYVNKYKHLVPEDYKLQDYNDIAVRNCNNNWEILW